MAELAVRLQSPCSFLYDMFTVLLVSSELVKHGHGGKTRPLDYMVIAHRVAMWHLVTICVWLFVTPWTVACQAPPSMGFSRHEYWSGLPLPSPRDLPDPGMEARSPALQTDFLPPELPGKPRVAIGRCLNIPGILRSLFYVLGRTLYSHLNEQVVMFKDVLAE